MKSFEDFQEEFVQKYEEEGFNGDPVETTIQNDGFLLTDDSGNALDDEGELCSFPNDYSNVYETADEAGSAASDYADNNPDAAPLIMRPITLTLIVGAPFTAKTGGDVVNEAIDGVTARAG